VTDRSDLLLVLARAVARRRAGAGPRALCRAAVALLEADGGAVTCVRPGSAPFTACATDDLAARLADLEGVVGDGPGTHALREGRPVRTVLGSGLPVPARLGGFAAAAAELPAARGPLAVRAWPVRTAHGAVGVLAVHGPVRDPGAVPVAAAGQVLADALAPGLLTVAEPRADLPVQRAVGMVVAQTGLPPQDAHALLRARAWVDGVPLAEVAAAVLDRRTTFGGSTAGC